MAFSEHIVKPVVSHLPGYPTCLFVWKQIILAVFITKNVHLEILGLRD